MDNSKRHDENDPDYTEFHYQTPLNHAEIKLSGTKVRNVEKIDRILRREFKIEVDFKEREIALAERRINQTKAMLDRLRAYVLASYYGAGENLEASSRAVWKRRPKRKRNSIGSEVNSMPLALGNDETKAEGNDLSKGEKGKLSDHSNALANVSIGVKIDLQFHQPVLLSMPSSLQADPIASGHRFYCTRQIIVGNVSKYLLAESRKEKDKSTHKWMVYVRGPKHDSEISDFVEYVSFFLHPSYIPNDIVHVRKPPFQLTRRGWGEFPVRVQLNFIDKRNKKLDVIHNLKLDKTYTGLQTLGAETIVDLELHRHAMMLSQSAVPESDGLSHKANLLMRVDSDPGFNTRTSVSEHKPASIARCYSSCAFSRMSASVPSSPVHFSDSFVASKRLQMIKSESASVASSCVSSAVASPCPSPTAQLSQAFLKSSDRTRESSRSTLLHQLVRRTPLYEEKRDIGLHHFAARSLEQFQGWSVSKRRASEWQRACFVRRLFEDLLCRRLISLEVPSTKEILLWCRNNGYSPNEKDGLICLSDDSHFCGLCGRLDLIKFPCEWCTHCLETQSEPIDINSRTFSDAFISDLQKKEDALSTLTAVRANAESDDAIVDVVSVTEQTSSPVTVSSSRYEEEVPCSSEISWVYESCAQIGLHLPCSNLHGVRSPVVSAMLLEACRRFVGEVLRRSYADCSGLKRSSLDPCVVTPIHVYSAISTTDRFDFLTGMCLGLPKEASALTKPMKQNLSG